MKFTVFPNDRNPFDKKGVVKFGIDPTGPDLHLGHLLPLRIVKKFKDLQFDVQIILGTFTAQIGDATGRDVTRPILKLEQTIENANALISQVRRILGPDVNINFNDQWHNKMSMLELMDIISKFSIQHLLNRDNFQNRLNANIPIATHEIMGPILQGIDSFKLNTAIEVGGTDQLFNFTISRDVQEIMGQEPQICVMSPIINGLDGRKMSKSFGNCIFINDKPEDVFGKAMSISDKVMFEWLPIFFDEFDAEKHPMILKKELAHKITCEIWGLELAEEAKNHFQNVIQGDSIPDNIEEVELDTSINIVSKAINVSKSEARRLFKSNAIKINGEKVDEDFNIKPGDILRIGKRNFFKIV